METPPTSPTTGRFLKKEPTEVVAEFGKSAVEDDETQILPKYRRDAVTKNSDLRTVLYGYGIVGALDITYVDDYTFVGGVCRNIPKNIANAWAKGIRWQDDKPAVSRIYPQAILKNDATPVDFAKATGIQPMEASQLAALIGAADAKKLVEAMGQQQALNLIEQMREHIG